MSIREEKTRHDPGDKGSRFKAFGLFVLALLLLQEVKTAVSVPEDAFGAESPQLILNRTASFSLPREISGNNGHEIAQSHSEIPVEIQQTKQFFTDSELKKTNSSMVIKGNKQILDSRRPNSSQFPSYGISPLDNERNSSKIDTDLFNLSYSLNSSTNLQSSPLNNLNKTRSTSTPLKTKGREKNKVQSELKLLSEKSSLLPNQRDYRDANDVTKTYNQSRKKKRRKFLSGMNAAKHHRHNKSHQKNVGRKLVDFDEVGLSEDKPINRKRSVKLSGNYPEFFGTGKERLLLRFKRKSVEDNETEPPHIRKKGKRKKRRETLPRHAKPRSLPMQHVSNGQMSRLTTGYPRGAVWGKTTLGRYANSFQTTTDAISQMKYDQQINRGQSLYFDLNSDRLHLRPDQYVWRKNLPAVNAAQNNVQVAQQGQLPLANVRYGTRKSAIKSAWPGTFQRIGNADQTQIQQQTKYRYAANQPQRLLDKDVLSRKQAIQQRPFFVYEPHFSSSQIALTNRNQQIARLTQPGSLKSQFFPPGRARTNVWSPILPELRNHVIQADDVLKGSRGPQGLIMYLNFEDVERGRAPYTSFNGDVVGGGKRTEIWRSFGSCGKVARINNGSEILLNGGQIKVKPRQAISIAAWIRLDNNKGYHSIFDTVGGHSFHQKGQYHFEIQDGSVRWFHRNESDNTIFSIETAPIIPANVWNHVAGTYSAHTGVAKVFVNGRLKAKAVGKGLLSQDWDAHAGIGKHKGSRFLQGDVDEFRIYNKALTQTEIQNLMKICSFERACGGFFYSPSGVIESPEWPHHYKGKTLCTWHVIVDPSDKISLRFNTFALEEDGTCSKAKLVVRDGNSANANVLGVYCGNKRPPELVSSGNRLWIQFTSTEEAEGKGFLLHYDTASFRQTKKTERPPTPFDGTQRCAVTKPQYNVTLVGGIKSGIFSEAKHVHDMDLCTRHCCLRKFCDLAFMIRDTCYLVKCASLLLCKTKKARPSSMNPRISFVSHLSAVTPGPELSADGSAYSNAATQTAPGLSADGSAYSKTGTQGPTTPSIPEVSAQSSAYSKPAGTQRATNPTAPDLSADGSSYSKAFPASVVSSTASPTTVQPVCHHTAVSYNVTLVGGIRAGKFSTYGSTRNMDECIRHCCHDNKCDVSFMIQGNCYAVECADTEGCQIKRAKPSAYHPTVAYVYRGSGRPIGDPLPGAVKPNPDACSNVTISNTIFNVTLRGGIKAGNFTDKGLVKNMKECSAYCCADERCNVAFLIRDNCFLVACKDYDSCKMKPALSEYYRPRMVFVNWSPPDDEIPATRWYASLGCWKDTESFAVSSLEGSDSLLQGSFLKRDKPVDTCAQVARKHDYKVFAIQNGGACLGGPHAGRIFNQYGESTSCKEGKGGLFANDVYRLTDSGSYVSLGCWNDTGGHALPLLEHSEPRLDDFYQTRSDPLEKCGKVARKRGYTVFALQRGGMCFGGPLAEIHYRRYGISRKCHHGLGGVYANSVYRLIDNLETTPMLPTTTSASVFTEVPSSTTSSDLTPTTQISSQATSPSPTTPIQENYLTLQDGVPLRNSYKAGDILYNVTLKYGIKSGKFSDKGKVGNMPDCIKACGKMETCSLAFMLGKQCFAVSCYNDALCITKPAYSPFYKPQIAFVKHTKEIVTANASKGALSDFDQCRTSIVHNDVTLVGGINAGKFTDLGDAENMTICSQRCCFKDACDVAFMLEGECYGVKCVNESLCETRPARNPERYNPKIVYIYHDKQKDKATLQQKSVCWDGQVLHNYTLVGGINAGTFTDNGKASNMDICMQFCCKRDTCDLAFMIEDDCYSVACNSNGACEPRKARPTHYLPRIAIRKKPQGNFNVKVPPSTEPTSSTLTPSPFLSSSSTPGTSPPTTSYTTPETHQADASVRVTHSCDASPIEYNVTLKMGLHSGEFQKIGKVESMDDCIEMSCRQTNSDVAFMLGSICFAVHCYSADLCKTVPIFGSSISRLNLNPAISFLRKKSRFRTNSLAVQNDEIYQDKCRDSTITYNVTLRGGIDAGNFTERVGTVTMRDCIGKCCEDNACDLAFMFGENCYSVECRNEKLCQAVLAKPSRLEPKISYITRGYFDDKDKGTMFSASDQTPTCRADQKFQSMVVSNKTLVGGLEAGKFTFVGVVSDMDMCMDRCCAQQGCNVAYMVDKNCFSVSCFSPTLCEISDVSSANGDVKISTIMNSTAERPSEKNSMIVYVVIGVVGFAAGAGGILWAVCMFIRRHRLRSRHRQDTE